MIALEGGAHDVEVSDDAVEVYTDRTDLAQVTQVLQDNGYKPDESELMMKPNTPMALGAEEAGAVMSMIDALEELDDVNKVYHNLELTDDLVAQFA